MSSRALTMAELGELPAVTDIVTAGRALGIGRTKAYELARAGEFPCRILRIGNSYVVPTAELHALLGLPCRGDEHRTPESPEAGPAPDTSTASPNDTPNDQE